MRTRMVRLLATNAEIWKWDVIYAAANTGADRLATDTDASQTNILGVALEHKAASSGGWILIADAIGNDFEAQTYSANTTFAYGDETSLYAGVTLRASTTGDTNTKTSKQSVEAIVNGTNPCAYIVGLSPIPNNDAASTATNYPILVIRFRTAFCHDYLGDV